MKEGYRKTNEISRESENEPALIMALKSAIGSDNVDDVMSALSKLDKYLTGSISGTFADKSDATRQEVEEDVRNFLEEIKSKRGFGRLLIYLGDGGYSRLLLNLRSDGEIDIELTANASEEVRKRWEEME